MASQLNNLTNFADQAVVLQLPDGTVANMELIYEATAERWILNISYGELTINGLGLCCYPNVLRQWRNLIPFGLACTTRDQTDPFTVNDFATGRVLLFLLTAGDVAQVESSIFGGAQV